MLVILKKGINYVVKTSLIIQSPREKIQKDNKYQAWLYGNILDIVITFLIIQKSRENVKKVNKYYPNYMVIY